MIPVTPAYIRRHAPLAAVVLLSLAGLALRLYRADDPLGGFHAFNEGFYIAQAQGYAYKGLASALFSPGDYNNPPLFSVLVALLFKLFGEGVFVARIVSAASSAATILCVYGLGTEVYDRKTGLLAASVFAFMPGAVLLGHNIQVDSTMLALTTGAVYAFVRTARRPSTLGATTTGILLGLAILTKITAVLVIPALVLWIAHREGSVRRLLTRENLLAAAATAIVAGSWYAVQIGTNGATFYQSQRGLAGTIGFPTLHFLGKGFLLEFMWMVSPVILALLLTFCAFSAMNRDKRDLLLWLLLAFNGAFYLFYHFHTYYLITLAPYAAIGAGRALTALGIDTWKRVAAAGAPLAGALLILSLSTMAALKYGDSGLSRIDDTMDVRAPGSALLATGVLLDNVGPAATFTSRRQIGRFDIGGPGAIPNEAILSFWEDWGFKLDRPYALLPRTGVRLVAFGIGIRPIADWAWGFMLNSIEAKRVGGLLDFGLQEYEAEPAYVLWLPSPTEQASHP